MPLTDLDRLNAQETERLTDVCKRLAALSALPLAGVVHGMLQIDNDYLLPLLSDLAGRAGL